MTLSMKADEYLRMLIDSPDCALAASMGTALRMISASFPLLLPSLQGNSQRRRVERQSNDGQRGFRTNGSKTARRLPARYRVGSDCPSQRGFMAMGHPHGQ